MQLPEVNIRVTRAQWEKLNVDVWEDDFVEAEVLKNGVWTPVGLRYRGGQTRNHSKKSFELRQANSRVHYNAENNDPSLIRNALSFEFFRDIGLHSPETRHCVLTVNGQNQGVYLEIEGVDELFFQRRGLAIESLVYAVNDDANFSLLRYGSRQFKRSLFDGYELVIDNGSTKEKLEAFVLNLNLKRNTALMRYLVGTIDVENYLKWLAAAVCVSNYDGFTQNYAMYRDSLDKKYDLIPWDYEGTWGRNCLGELCSSHAVRIQGYNILTKKILSIGRFRHQYKETLQNVLTNNFTLERLIPPIVQSLDMIGESAMRDPLRSRSPSTLKRERNLIANYIRKRRRYLYGKLNSL